MNKEKFLKEHWFNFPNPKGTTHTLEYTPKNNGNIDAIQEIILNNTDGLSDLEMRFELSRAVINDKSYEFTDEDAQSINDIHEEYNLRFPEVRIKI